MLAVLQKGGAALVLWAAPMGDASTPPGLSQACLAALGPKPTVLAVNARGVETLAQILAYASAQTGIGAFWLACLAGFSAGCAKVRAWRLGGARAYGYVLCDGLHASTPPEAWQLDYARGLVADARAGSLVAVLTHSYIATEPAYTSTHRMAELATGLALPAPPAKETRVQRDAGLSVYSTGGKDAAAHTYQVQQVLPRALAQEIRPLVELEAAPSTAPGSQGVASPPAGPSPQKVVPGPARVYVTGVGALRLEEDYLPRVVTAEVPAAFHLEAKRAVAVASRTFVRRAMLDQPGLGTEKRPLDATERFLVVAPGARADALRAVRETAGGVAQWNGELVLGNMVAGAIWTSAGPSRDPTKTERFVTYNHGKRGADVRPTTLARAVPANRGCLSQNAAQQLALWGASWAQILRYHYGADLALSGVQEPPPRPWGRARAAPPRRPAPALRVDSPVLFPLAFFLLTQVTKDD